MSGLWVEISAKGKNYYIVGDVDLEVAMKACNRILATPGQFVQVNNPGSHFINKDIIDEVRIVHKDGRTYQFQEEE